MSKLNSNAITHIGLIVRDIEATRRRYIEILGAPEAAIGVVDPPAIAKTQYHGQPSSAGAKLCHLRLGPIQVELIQPLGGPSTWQDFLDKKGEGVHHIAFVTEDATGDVSHLKAMGCPEIQSGEWVGGKYFYVDAVPALGVMLELIRNGD